MSRPDNVVPLRPRRRPRKQLDLKAPRSQVLLVHGLTALTFGLYLLTKGPWDYVATAFGVAALAIAASRRSDGMPWACTHHEFALRTLLIGGVGWVLASLLGLVPGVGAAGALWALLGVCAWVGLRVVWGFARGVVRLPILRPKTPLI